ncbi:MAG: hypothetical protein LQ350_004228 [Teloschistes chrysophthalmus]|nr:MAG: hypothetical protein LQ350_004228 [Niorma chrysophthalma]
MAALAGYSSMTDRRDGTQPRIPRLTYRCHPSTASISDQSVITTRTDSSAASISTCATSPPTSSFGGSPRSFHFSDDAPSPFSLDGASDSKPSPSFLAPQTAANEPKKKSSSFFKFFSVKEPSTQAFEAYQEQMKKRGTTQNGRANAVGLPGVSSAKLPATVPKVNSKWDGVPPTAKDRAKEKDLSHRRSFSSVARPVHTSQSNASNLTTSSTISTSSSSSTRSVPRVNGKLRLDDSSGNLSDIYGWESPPIQSNNTSSLSIDHHHHHRPSHHSRENSSSFSFSFFNNTRPPTIPEAEACTTEPEPSSSPPPLDPSSSAHTSPAITPNMPQTPTDDAVVPALPLPLATTHLHPYPTEPPHLPPPAVKSSRSTEAVVGLTSAGSNVLGPPVSATWKPKPTTPSRPFPANGATRDGGVETRDGEAEARQREGLKRPAWGSSGSPLAAGKGEGKRRLFGRER